MSEASVTINGVELSIGQAMAVRVACTAFHSDLVDPLVLGDDEHGRRMALAYRQQLEEVLQLMLGPGR